MYSTRAAPILLAAGFWALSCIDSTRPAGYPAAFLVVSGNNQSAPAGTELPEPLVARVVDSSGAPVSGQIVNFHVTAGGGSVFAGAAITDDLGIVRERWTLGVSIADSQRMEARAVANFTGVPIVFGTFKAVVLAGPPASFVPSGGDGQRAGVGTALLESLSVALTDQYGNQTPAVSVTWAVLSGGGSITPSSLTDSAGVARAPWTMGPAGGPASAMASVPD